MAAFGSLASNGAPMMGMDPRMAQLMPMAMQMMRNGAGGGQPPQPGMPPPMPPPQPGQAPPAAAPPGLLNGVLGVGGPGNGLLNQLMQKFRQQQQPGQPMNIDPSAGAPGAMIPPIPVAGAQPSPGPNQLTGMW